MTGRQACSENLSIGGIPVQSDNRFRVQAGAALHGYASTCDSSHPDKQTRAACGHCIANEGGLLPSLSQSTAL